MLGLALDVDIEGLWTNFNSPSHLSGLRNGHRLWSTLGGGLVLVHHPVASPFWADVCLVCHVPCSKLDEYGSLAMDTFMGRRFRFLVQSHLRFGMHKNGDPEGGIPAARCAWKTLQGLYGACSLATRQFL